MTHNSTWKRHERKTAEILRGKRVGITGMSTVDVEHAEFEIECKLRAKLAFIPWFEQAAQHAKKSDKIPLLVCKQKGGRGEYAIIRLTDFADLLERIPATE